MFLRLFIRSSAENRCMIYVLMCADGFQVTNRHLNLKSNKRQNHKVLFFFFLNNKRVGFLLLRVPCWRSCSICCWILILLADRCHICLCFCWNESQAKEMFRGKILKEKCILWAVLTIIHFRVAHTGHLRSMLKIPMPNVNLHLYPSIFTPTLHNTNTNGNRTLIPSSCSLIIKEFCRCLLRSWVGKQMLEM